MFNIFVTGRVIITGSRDYVHTCKCWWWLYTHVLVRHRRGTAARTTSSAAYKAETQRTRDTFSSDCDRIAAKFARRANGPLAQSQYGEMLRTPRSVLHRSMTPVMTPMRGNEDVRQGASSVLVLFRRIQDYFVGHTVHCPFVRGKERGAVVTADKDAHEYWRNELRALECGYAGVDEDGHNLATVLEPHFDAKCMSIGVIRDRNRLGETALEYMNQLHAALHEPDAEMPDCVAATAESALKRAGPASALQQLEVEDVFDPEAQFILDQYRHEDDATADLAFAPHING